MDIFYTRSRHNIGKIATQNFIISQLMLINTYVRDCHFARTRVLLPYVDPAVKEANCFAPFRDCTPTQWAWRQIGDDEGLHRSRTAEPRICTEYSRVQSCIYTWICIYIRVLKMNGEKSEKREGRRVWLVACAVGPRERKYYEGEEAVVEFFFYETKG